MAQLNTSSWALSILQAWPQSTRTTLTCPGGACTPPAAQLSAEEPGTAAHKPTLHPAPAATFMPPPFTCCIQREQNVGWRRVRRCSQEGRCPSKGLWWALRTTWSTRSVTPKKLQLFSHQHKPLFKKRCLIFNLFAFVHYYCTFLVSLSAACVVLLWSNSFSKYCRD